MSLIISHPRAVNSQQSSEDTTAENETAFSKASITIQLVETKEEILFDGNLCSATPRMTRTCSIIVTRSADTFKKKNFRVFLK